MSSPNLPLISDIHEKDIMETRFSTLSPLQLQKLQCT